MKRRNLPKEFEDAVDKVLGYRPPGKTRRKRRDGRTLNLDKSPDTEATADTEEDQPPS